MTTVAAKINRPVAIRQVTVAGNDFGSAAPEDVVGPISPVFADDIYKFDDLVAGGLFDPTNSYYAFEPRETLVLIGVEFDFAGATSWTFDLIDVDGNVMNIWKGTETTFVVTADTHIMLMWGTKLGLTTGGSALAMHATLKLAPAWYLNPAVR